MVLMFHNKQLKWNQVECLVFAFKPVYKGTNLVFSELLVCDFFCFVANLTYCVFQTIRKKKNDSRLSHPSTSHHTSTKQKHNGEAWFDVARIWPTQPYCNNCF